VSPRSIHPEAKVAYLFDNYEGEAELRVGGLDRNTALEGIVRYPLTVSRAAILVRDLAQWLAVKTNPAANKDEGQKG
jgi:hypothetical protein